MDIVDVFRNLNKLTSVKDKENLLKENDSEDLRKLLEANLNPYRQFYIKKLPCEFRAHENKLATNAALKLFYSLLTKLETRTITGLAAKKEISFLFDLLEESEYVLLESILLKEAIGVGVTTVNKVWKNLIPEFKVMLAPNELANPSTLKYPVYIQPKLDGFRCIFSPNGDGTFTFTSRSGKSFGNAKLSEYFRSLSVVDDYILDGELYATSVNFNKLASALSAEDTTLPKDLTFVVYDCLTLDEWNNRKCKLSYENRLKRLRQVLNDQVSNYAKVIDISNDKVSTPKELLGIYKNHLDAGYEGAMLKSPEGFYEWKRVTSKSGIMLKLKPFKTLDLPIVGVYEGEGNFEGLAGGIIVEYKGTNVRCGSGFDIATRKVLKEHTSRFLGKVVEIKYFEETPDGSLRFPTFVRFRPDKSDSA